MPDPDRIHRVARLRPDEVEYLEREAGNRVSDPCCPHLGVFHHQRDNEDGSGWRVCEVSGCPCSDNWEPGAYYVARKAQNAELERQEQRDVRFTWWFFGAVSCLLAVKIAFVVGWL